MFINGMNLHREMKYHGRQIVIDATYIDDDLIEIACIDKEDPAIEHEIKRTRDPEEAERIYNDMRYRYSNQPHAELKGKYKKLRNDLFRAMEVGRQADSPEDGGTCNFDAPAIEAPRWIESMVKQAAKEAGTSAFKWKLYRKCFYVFAVPEGGQANRRSRKAEAMTRYLESIGYSALTYSSMD